MLMYYKKKIKFVVGIKYMFQFVGMVHAYQTNTYHMVFFTNATKIMLFFSCTIKFKHVFY